jgi:hypothetical protein
MAFILLWRRDALECIAAVGQGTYQVHLLHHHRLLRAEHVRSADAAMALSTAWEFDDTLVASVTGVA